MTNGRKALIAFLIVVVLLGLGFAWGARGRGELREIVDGTRQSLNLAEARGAILEARVSLYNNNFGDASRQFEQAKEPLRRLKGDLEDAAAASRVDAALQHVEEGQRLAGKLDAAAQNSATAALDALRTAFPR